VAEAEAECEGQGELFRWRHDLEEYLGTGHITSPRGAPHQCASLRVMARLLHAAPGLLLLPSLLPSPPPLLPLVCIHDSSWGGSGGGGTKWGFTFCEVMRLAFPSPMVSCPAYTRPRSLTGGRDPTGEVRGSCQGGGGGEAASKPACGTLELSMNGSCMHPVIWFSRSITD
jgi:hypothetical protein